MAIQFLKVVFPEDRMVLANGDPVGPTNATLMLPPGDYAVSIQGGNCAPISQDVVLNGTTVTNPLTITFGRAASTAIRQP